MRGRREAYRLGISAYILKDKRPRYSRLLKLLDAYMDWPASMTGPGPRLCCSIEVQMSRATFGSPTAGNDLLLNAMTELQTGDFSVRLPRDWTGLPQARTFRVCR